MKDKTKLELVRTFLLIIAILGFICSVVDPNNNLERYEKGFMFISSVIFIWLYTTIEITQKKKERGTQKEERK